MNAKLAEGDIDSKIRIEKTSKYITEIERKRHSLLYPDLTTLELEVLKGIAQGRNLNEMQNAIKLHSMYDSYHAVVKRLLRKFEAFTLAHVVFKAIKMGILDTDF